MCVALEEVVATLESSPRVECLKETLAKVTKAVGVAAQAVSQVAEFDALNCTVDACIEMWRNLICNAGTVGEGGDTTVKKRSEADWAKAENTVRIRVGKMSLAELKKRATTISGEKQKGVSKSALQAMIVEADLAKLRKEEEELCEGSALQRILGGDINKPNDESEDDEDKEARVRAYEKMFPLAQVALDVKQKLWTHHAVLRKGTSLLYDQWSSSKGGEDGQAAQAGQDRNANLIFKSVQGNRLKMYLNFCDDNVKGVRLVFVGELRELQDKIGAAATQSAAPAGRTTMPTGEALEVYVTPPTWSDERSVLCAPAWGVKASNNDEEVNMILQTEKVELVKNKKKQIKNKRIRN